MKGFQVHRKAGWDTHGLPVELGVEKELGTILIDHLEWVGHIAHVLTHLVALSIEHETRRAYTWISSQ